MQDIVKFALSLSLSEIQCGKKIHILNRKLWCWKLQLNPPKQLGKERCHQLRWSIIFAESIWKCTGMEYGGGKKDCVFVLFLVSQFCLVTIFNQRTYVRSTMAWTQEWMEVYLRNINYFNWSIIALQCCVSLRCTMKWISYSHTYFPSLLGLPPNPPRIAPFRPSQSTELSFLHKQQVPTSYLFYRYTSIEVNTLQLKKLKKKVI